MGLPRPNPFEFPDSPEQLASDLILHGAISVGVAVGVGAYTGAWAGPGTIGTIAYALFDTAPLGASGVVAFEETMFALSVYAEPFIAVGLPVAAVASTVAAVKVDELFIDQVVSSENISNVEKSVILGGYTNVPYF